MEFVFLFHIHFLVLIELLASFTEKNSEKKNCKSRKFSFKVEKIELT